jgi:NAD(P)-dependent dehydrogenase (short-subunit alcohol dehydrogenase family)
VRRWTSGSPSRRFVEGGADVLLVDLDEAALPSAAERLAGAQGKVETLALDVGDDDAGQCMVEQCVARFGGLDILVSNAGIFPQAPVLEMPGRPAPGRRPRRNAGRHHQPVRRAEGVPSHR